MQLRSLLSRSATLYPSRSAFTMAASTSTTFVGQRAFSLVPLPTATLHTQYGQLPNLLRDTAICLSTDLAPLFSARQAHFWEHDEIIARTGKTLKDYCNMAERTAVLTLREPSDLDKYDSTDGSVTISATCGMRPLSLSLYAQQIARMRPDVALLMHDDVPQDAGKKRRRNASDRTQRWLGDCRIALELAFAEEEKKAGRSKEERPAFFVAVPAVPDPVARKKLLEGISALFTPVETAAPHKVAVSGFFFPSSFWDHDGGLDLELLQKTLEALPPKDKALPRMISAPLNPLEALTAVVSLGIDVIDSDYASALAFAGYALTFDVEPPASSSSSASSGSSGAAAMPVDEPAPAPAVIDLNDAALYKRDGSRIKAGCPCFACAGTTEAQVSAHLSPSGLAAGGAAVASGSAITDRSHPGHTRAYLHHLTDCGEILGRSLLSAHNAVHVARFMKAVRDRANAGDGGESLRQYMEWFKGAYGAVAVEVASESAVEGKAAIGSMATDDGEAQQPKRKNPIPSVFPSLKFVLAAAKESAGREFNSEESSAPAAGAAGAGAAAAHKGGRKQPASK